MEQRLASGPQLWRLNKEGRLTINAQAGESIDHTKAWELVSTLAAGNLDAFEVDEPVDELELVAIDAA